MPQQKEALRVILTPISRGLIFPGISKQKKVETQNLRADLEILEHFFTSQKSFKEILM